jgi:hypothetical protein
VNAFVLVIDPQFQRAFPENPENTGTDLAPGYGEANMLWNTPLLVPQQL